MNIGLIIAGGVGARMHIDTPKQFMKIMDKEVIFYTLEAFQNHPDIDAIAVVCLDGWQNALIEGAKKYNITKMLNSPDNGIIPGGDTGMHSLRNGMLYLKEHFPADSIIVIHDAVRPLISQQIITNNIDGVKNYSTAITSVHATEALLKVSPECPLDSSEVVDRNRIMRTQTPQSLRLEKFIWAHEEAVKRNIQDTVATCTLLVELGEKVHLVDGDNTNIKITTKEDLDLVEAFLKIQQKSAEA